MDGVTFKLEVFEGPLDLLLFLLSKNKLSIYDIPISDILTQYMEYLRGMESMDLEVASEFVQMASQLVYIKSRMLMPKRSDTEEDPRMPLVAALEEYQIIKEGAAKLKERAVPGWDVMAKPPEPLSKEKEYKYRHKTSDLMAALYDVIERTGRKAPPPVVAFSGIVGRELASVKERIKKIISMFRTSPVLDMLAIMREAGNRSGVVASFLAVLDLAKDNRVSIADAGDGVYQISLTDGGIL